ncbi:protein FAR1-RELATED SEQUENCE 6 [Eucalyptus grandis]|uniref:protein FAR1-RELATED SEQUENCE 6 n=1 Tax=Eucalyptus grandis TaxID=71139 RepID=UPI00192ED2D3|nr:protein FAR1-RELATED SEQUENCE 6 [Eucalyptus grandis]
MDEVSLNAEPVGDDEAEELEIEGDSAMTGLVGQTSVIQGENPMPPAVGMEFESYEDVYYFYSCYAKEHGFGVRVSNTWYRKSKERYRGKLSCSSAGFKKKSEANRPRPETRTGCPAMIKFRLMDNTRWRIIEVELEHNHLISPTSGKFFKSHKVMGVGTKRPLELEGPEEVETVKLFQTVIIDAEGGKLAADDGDLRKNPDLSNKMKLRKGDAQAALDFFCQMQLMDPNFFYVADLNERGYLRNLFWAATRSRVAYRYFGDVVAIDTTFFGQEFDILLVSFIGVNHHGQPVLLGCGLLAGETFELYVWLLRAWLTCILGRPPQTIISDQCKALQAAIFDVFPRASHCIDLTKVMRRISERLEITYQYEAIKAAVYRAVCLSQRAEEFEAAWMDIIHEHGLEDHQWFQSLYEERNRWVPVYLKETFLAGMFTIQQNEDATSFFKGYIGNCTSLKEFLDKYDQAMQRSHQLEALADLDSRNSSCMLNSRCNYELQLSKLYTGYIFMKFQKEVEGMYSCFSTRQVNVDGLVTTYTVQEHVELEDGQREARDFEVLFNGSEMEVFCACGLFNLRGYLCRHALHVLSQNRVEEVPPQYVLSRWRKDIKRGYVLDQRSAGIDIDNPVHRHEHLHKCILQVMDEARKSQDRSKVALQALDEMLNKIQLSKDHPE